MEEELFAQLKDLTGRQGPFMDYDIDSVLMPSLLAWVGSDWQRLRVLLNYMHGRGEQVAVEIARRSLAGLLGSSEHRLVGTWEYRLKNPDWYLSE